MNHNWLSKQFIVAIAENYTPLTAPNNLITKTLLLNDLKITFWALEAYYDAG